MKSICIKNNNSNLLDYLLNELNYIEIEPVYISSNKFKNYKNIIIHYRGNNNKKFIHEVSCILSCLVIDELEEKFLKNIITTISIMSLDIYLASSLIDHIVYTIFNSKLALYNIPQSRCILYAPIVLIITFTLSSLYASIRRILINVR